MNASSTHCRGGVRAATTAVLAALTLVPAAQGYTNVFVDDFNDGNDDGWTRVNPVYYQGPPVYSFPNGAYRIQVPPASAAFYAGGGFSYAVGYRTNLLYSDFIATLDFVEEDAELRNRVALVTRAEGYEFDNSFHVPAYHKGYELGTCWDPAAQMQALYLELVNGWPLTLHTTFFARVSGRRYRLVFTGRGDHLFGQIFDLQDLTAALATVAVTDSTHDAGYVGFAALNLDGLNHVANRGVDVTLDNFAVAVPDPLHTFAEDFDSGSDAGLSRFEPFAASGLRADFTFADGALTMWHPPSPAPDIGPAAVGEFLTELAYTDADSAIDFWGWNDNDGAVPSFSLCVRLTARREGQLDFYSATFNPAGGPDSGGFYFNPHVAIMVWSNGIPVVNLGASDVRAGTFISPFDHYRLHLSPQGHLLTARLFQYPDLTVPIAEVSARDSIYASGRAGILASDWLTLTGGNNPTQITVDDYSVVGALAPPALTIQRTDNAGLVLSWPAFATGNTVESAPSVAGPWSAVGGSPDIVGDRYQQAVAVTTSFQLFRLRQLGLLD